MVKWRGFIPSDFEYDFENDKLVVHHVTLEEAVECFFSDFEVRRNKRFKDINSSVRLLAGASSRLYFNSKLATLFE